MAQLCALFYNANRGKGAQALSADDFLPYRNAWKNSRYSSDDLKTLAAMGIKR